MMKKSVSILQRFSIIISTGFGIGYVPVVPGTFGTLWGIPIYLAVHRGCVYVEKAWSIPFLVTYLLIITAFSLLGVWVAGIAEQAFSEKDPGKIVIDEIAGFLVTMAGTQAGLPGIVSGFIVFRILDIMKFPPANIADKRVSGGLGIMLDDLIAGVQGVVILAILHVIIT